MILSPQNQCLLKSSVILPSWISFLFSRIERIFTQVETHANTSLQTNIPQNEASKAVTALELHFLCPNKESDSIFIIMTSVIIGKWHHNHRNDTSATSILCQTDVKCKNRNWYIIEIRIRNVITNVNDVIISQDAHFRSNMTLNVFHIYDEKRRCKMPERYKPDVTAHSVTIWKTKIQRSTQRYKMSSAWKCLFCALFHKLPNRAERYQTHQP